MKKILRYLRRTLRMSFLLNLEYRMDLIWFLFMMPVFLASELLGIYFIFVAGNITTIAGFTFKEFLFVSSLSALAWMLTSLTAIGAGLIVRQINDGKLDIFLLKPLPLFTAVMGQKFYVKRFLQIFVRIILLFCIVYFGQMTFTIKEIFLIIYIFLTTLILYFSIFIAIESVTFWIPKFDGAEFLFEFIDQVIYYPAGIYPDIFRNVLTYIVPIFLLANPVYLVLQNTYQRKDMLITFLLTILWIIIAKIVWSTGQRAYQSAN